MTSYLLKPVTPTETQFQVWTCDDEGLARMQEVIKERGHTYEAEIVPYVNLDMGGMVHSDDPLIKVEAAGITFELWAHQLAYYLEMLKSTKPAEDNPTVKIIPGRWRRTIVSLATHDAFVVALEACKDEAARLTAEHDQRMAAAMERVNKDRPRVVQLDAGECGL